MYMTNILTNDLDSTLFRTTGNTVDFQLCEIKNSMIYRNQKIGGVS